VLCFWEAHHWVLSRSEGQAQESLSSFVTPGSSGKLAPCLPEIGEFISLRNKLTSHLVPLLLPTAEACSLEQSLQKPSSISAVHAAGDSLVLLHS